MGDPQIHLQHKQLHLGPNSGHRSPRALLQRHRSPQHNLHHRHKQSLRLRRNHQLHSSPPTRKHNSMVPLRYGRPATPIHRNRPRLHSPNLQKRHPPPNPNGLANQSIHEHHVHRKHNKMARNRMFHSTDNPQFQRHSHQQHLQRDHNRNLGNQLGNLGPGPQHIRLRTPEDPSRNVLQPTMGSRTRHHPKHKLHVLRSRRFLSRYFLPGSIHGCLVHAVYV